MAHQAAAVMAASRMGGMMYGAGIGAGMFVLFSNADSFKLYSKELARMTLHFLSRPGYDMNLLGNGGGKNSSNNEAVMGPLAERLDQLTIEMAKIRQGQTLVGLIGGMPSFSTVVIVVGTGGVIMWWCGIRGWADVMYVTKKHFNTTVAALQEGVTGLVSALARVRHELLEKVGIVEVKVDEARIALEGKIDGVHGEVVGVAKSQEMIAELIRGIEGQIELTQDQVKQANRGIAILCNVVAESGSSNEDLLEFTRTHGGGIQKRSSSRALTMPSAAAAAAASTMVVNKPGAMVTISQPQQEKSDFNINDVLLREGLQHLITMTAPARSSHQRPMRSTSSSNSECLPTAIPLSGYTSPPPASNISVKTSDPA